MPNKYIRKILQARVYDVAIETPLQPANRLSKRLKNQVLLKREDLQPTFSFKLRGAYNKIASLSTEERQRGVICASAGNHAQGVALSAQKVGIKATIVMPKTTPEIKVASVRSYGGVVVLHGDTYDEASTHAYQLAEQQQLTFIHPFDDPEVIAGQGTIAMEILRQCESPIDAIFIPVGGGGLAAGIGCYIKYLYPETRVIGVEPEDAPCMYRALAKNKRIVLDQVGIFADGVAVKQVGKESFRLAREVIDEVILVSTDETCAAIKDIFDDTRAITEPAGALAVAGIKKYVEREACRQKNLVAINSGANLNFDRLRHVSERAELGEKRETLLTVTIPEQPGSFKLFCETIGPRGITEFNYRYADKSEAHIFVGVRLLGEPGEKEQLLHDLVKQGYPVVDLSNNEMAKLHIRHMVGGRANACDERLYRFEFPEHPGALLRFLTKVGTRWNISMFHYRNHGAAYGRVLIGVQVPDGEQTQFHTFLHELGYRYWDETENPAYRLFLR